MPGCSCSSRARCSRSPSTSAARSTRGSPHATHWTDNLTGLGNHRAYQVALRSKIDESGRSGRPFSLCLVDLDNFKHINDTYGHPVGDDVLTRVSEMLA